MMTGAITTCHVHYLKLVADWEVHAPPLEASAIGTIAADRHVHAKSARLLYSAAIQCLSLVVSE
jgi:hypothetical protein